MDRYNRILFAGDPHGSFDSIINAVLHYKPLAVVMLGDYSLQQKLDIYLKPIADLTEIWWIYGNHDVASKADYCHLFESAYKHNGLHLKVREIAGLKIAGLGGIFMAKNWYPPAQSRWHSRNHWFRAQSPQIRRGGMPLKLKYSIWQHEVAIMQDTVQADILVTHEAPSCHRYGFHAIDELAKAIGARYIFHGHQHEYYHDKVMGNVHVTGVAKAMVVNLQGQNLSAQFQKDHLQVADADYLNRAIAELEQAVDH